MEQDNQKDIENEASLDISLAEQLGLDEDTVARLELEIKLEQEQEQVIINQEIAAQEIIEQEEIEQEIAEEEAEKEEPICVCPSEEIMPRIKEYINNESCNIVFAVTDKLLAKSKKDDELSMWLKGADMLISSQDLKSEDENDENLEEGLDVHLITQIASDEEIEKVSIMLMTEEQDLSDKFENRMNDLFEENEYLEYVGSYVVEPQTDDDSILNEINGGLPDVLVCACKTPYQEKWLLDNKSKMGVKLCIALSGEKEEFLQKKDSGMNIFSRLFGRQR